MKLHEITKEMQNLEELFLMSINEETGEIADSETLEKLEEQFKLVLQTKAEGVVGFIRNSDLHLDAVDTEIKRLQTLKKAGTRKLDNFKLYVTHNMEQMGIKKLETSLGTMSLRKSKSVGVDENIIDMEDGRFIKTEVKKSVSKTELKKLIEAGEEIQGAYIQEKNSLQVK